MKNAVVVIALLGAIWLISSKVSPPDSIMLKNFTGLNAGIRSPLENISRAYQAPVHSKEVAELLRNKPSNAGYIKGHPLHNTNGRAYVLLDNRGNDFDVLVKLVYLGTDVVYPARQVFIPAGQQFNKDSAEFPHLLGGGMNAVQALACWLMKPLHYRPLLVLYTA